MDGQDQAQVIADPKQELGTEVSTKNDTVVENLYGENTMVYNVFYSVNAFAGEKADVADNVALKVITIAFNYMLLILSAAYTANYATLLVNASVPIPPLLPSISIANSLGTQVCVLTGSPNIGYMKLNYPRVRLVEAPFPDYITNIKAGNCDGALISKMDWDYYQGLKSVNPSNDLILMEDKLMDVSAVLALFEDYDTRCTALLQQAMGWAITSENSRNSFMTAYNETVTGQREMSPESRDQIHRADSDGHGGDLHRLRGGYFHQHGRIPLHEGELQGHQVLHQA